MQFREDVESQSLDVLRGFGGALSEMRNSLLSGVSALSLEYSLRYMDDVWRARNENLQSAAGLVC